MATGDAQKSEVHYETADASTSPVAGGDAATTKNLTGHGQSTSKPKDIPASTAQTIIISDESGDGGPVVIQSQDPALQKVQVPQDAFPADGIPDVDVPSDAERPAKLRPTKG